MKVDHRDTEHRFVVRVGGDEAELAYTRPARGLIDIQHTYVPPGARGRGVGEALAAAAFEYARESGDRVVPSCPFVRRWLGEHPEYAAWVDRAYRREEDRPRP